MQVTAFELLYTLLTADLTSLTPTLWRSAYKDGVAVPTPVALGGTISATPAAAIVHSATNMFVTKWTVGTPFIIGNNAPDVIDMVEFAVIDAGSSVFAVYGIGVYFNYCLL